MNRLQSCSASVQQLTRKPLLGRAHPTNLWGTFASCQRGEFWHFPGVFELSVHCAKISFPGGGGGM